MTQKEADSARAEILFTDALHREERRDYKGAFDSFMAAAQLGNSGCQVNVGDYYAAGRGVKRDLTLAARWYRRAYRNGESAAAINLSVDLQKQGNLRGAIVWLKRAADMKDGEACLLLAKIYLQRRRGLKAAIALLTQAAQWKSISISDDSREEAAALLGGIRSSASG